MGGADRLAGGAPNVLAGVLLHGPIHVSPVGALGAFSKIGLNPRVVPPRLNERALGVFSEFDA